MHINARKGRNHGDNKKCGLVNVYKSLHGEYKEFTTHVNGSKVMDYMLVTKNVLQFIHKMGYIWFYEAFDSDHRAIYCDLSNKIFEEGDRDETSQREIMVSSNSTNIEGQNYIESIYQQMQHHNIFERSKALLHKTRNQLPQNESAIDALNEIDKFITITNDTRGLNASLQYAIKEHNKLCKNNTNDRNEYMEKLVEDLRERNNSKHVTIKQILQREKARSDFKTI
jgi:hypothetical protein